MILLAHQTSPFLGEIELALERIAASSADRYALRAKGSN
jgi:hypothetical protein